MYQTTNRLDIQGDKMDYQDGFEDGVTFAREVIIANIRLWAEKSEDGPAYDDIADRLETGVVDYDL